MVLSRQITLALLLLIALSTTIAADELADGKQQWGDLSGTFVFDGPIPAAKEIKHGAITVPDESLVVDAKTGGVANVFIYLLPVKDEKLIVHPSYDATAKATVTWEIDKHRFSPHAITARTSQTIDTVSKDADAHNPRYDVRYNSGSSLLLPGMGTISHRWPTPESIPVSTSDNIFAFMQGWFLVQDHPYMAVSDAEGKFTIKNLPVGKAMFRVWHEKGGFIKSVIVSTGAAEWPKGKLTKTINAGANDLGKIRFGGKLFE